MHYYIADLLTDIPAECGIASLCQDYLSDNTEEASISIDASLYNQDKWPGLLPELLPYMDSARQFYVQLLKFDGLMLHASCLVIDGAAYLFSGHSGVGKSTHTHLLQRYWPGESVIINDDKPALRVRDGQWIAYGTPWCGKDHINVNRSAPVRGICFLTECRERNELRTLTAEEGFPKLYASAIYQAKKETVLQQLPLLERLSCSVPLYELDSLANEATAQLLIDGMIRSKNE